MIQDKTETFSNKQALSDQLTGSSEKDFAWEQLAIATRIPGFGTITYGRLKLLPFWDPPRGDPRFERLVASLAPKE